jgi:hypothetical protein
MTVVTSGIHEERIKFGAPTSFTTLPYVHGIGRRETVEGISIRLVTL